MVLYVLKVKKQIGSTRVTQMTYFRLETVIFAKDWQVCLPVRKIIYTVDDANVIMTQDGSFKKTVQYGTQTSLFLPSGIFQHLYLRQAILTLNKLHFLDIYKHTLTDH